MTLKEKLLSLNLVVDNEYLDKYVGLIESNRDTKREKYKTQLHHIIPRYYYAENNLDVDNSSSNTVNLLYKDHFIAHLLLSLCSSEDKFMYNNFIALSYMNKNFDYKNLDVLQEEYEQCRKKCSIYNPMFNENHLTKHREVMRSDVVRQKISNTMKLKSESGELFSEEHRKHLSESMKGNVYVFKDKKITRIKRDDLDKYISEGWTLYEKRKYSQLCGREMMTVNNSIFTMFDTRSVGCYCILDTGERFDFKNIRNATIWWYENFKPFGEHYSECVLQRKIKQSISEHKIIYGQKCHKNYKEITNIQWYKTEE